MYYLQGGFVFNKNILQTGLRYEALLFVPFLCERAYLVEDLTHLSAIDTLCVIPKRGQQARLNQQYMPIVQFGLVRSEFIGGVFSNLHHCIGTTSGLNLGCDFNDCFQLSDLSTF